MQLILARHGNTFDPDTTPVWVGSRDDLPLVAQGRVQAQTLGASLLQANVPLSAVYCSSLQRTRVYAEIVLAQSTSQLLPIVDARLNELDFGAWSGLTTAQIQVKFGTAALAAWEQHSAWPAAAGWGASEAIVRAQVQAFCQQLVTLYPTDATVLVVSSNGRLRYFLDCVAGAFAQHIAQRNFKVRTGHICSLTYAAAEWTLHYWDKPPAVGLHVD